MISRSDPVLCATPQDSCVDLKSRLSLNNIDTQKYHLLHSTN